MVSDEHRAFRGVSRNHIHRVWRAAREGKTLSEEDQRLAQILLDHPEYRNFWEFADVMGEEDITDENGVNPFMHAGLHEIVENQLADGNPPAAREAMARLLRKGLPRHEVAHRIANLVTREIYRILKLERPFNEAWYVKALRRLK